MAKRKKHIAQEIPIHFQSNGKQIVGIHHRVESEKIVLMCHGFTGNKIENKRLYVEAARNFASDGISAIRFDFYGSGDSEGEFEDSLVSLNISTLKDAIAWAYMEGYDKVAVMGISMGAATAILALSGQPVQALVLWSAVPDFKLLFASYTENANDILASHNIIEHDGWAIKRDFFIDAMQHDVEGSLSKIEIPKFIVQGMADAPLFVEGFHRFRDIVLPPADFMEIPDAGHTYQTPHHRRQVIRQTAIWLQRHI